MAKNKKKRISFLFSIIQYSNYNIRFVLIKFQYDICDRFPDNFRGKGQKGPWFNTVGSNYGCSSATCCLWFPPIKCADVPLVKYAFLPFEHNGVVHNDCSDQDAAEENSITAAEIFEGSVRYLKTLETLLLPVMIDIIHVWSLFYVQSK